MNAHRKAFIAGYENRGVKEVGIGFVCDGLDAVHCTLLTFNLSGLNDGVEICVNAVMG